MPILLKTNLPDDANGKEKALSLMLVLTEKYSGLYQIPLENHLNIVIEDYDDEQASYNIETVVRDLISSSKLNDIIISEFRPLLFNADNFSKSSLVYILQEKMKRLATPATIKAIDNVNMSFELRYAAIKKRYESHTANNIKQAKEENFTISQRPQQSSQIEEETIVDPFHAFNFSNTDDTSSDLDNDFNNNNSSNSFNDEIDSHFNIHFQNNNNAYTSSSIMNSNINNSHSFNDSMNSRFSMNNHMGSHFHSPISSHNMSHNFNYNHSYNNPIDSHFNMNNTHSSNSIANQNNRILAELEQQRRQQQEAQERRMRQEELQRKIAIDTQNKRQEAERKREQERIRNQNKRILAEYKREQERTQKQNERIIARSEQQRRTAIEAQDNVLIMGLNIKSIKAQSTKNQNIELKNNYFNYLKMLDKIRQDKPSSSDILKTWQSMFLQNPVVEISELEAKDEMQSSLIFNFSFAPNSEKLHNKNLWANINILSENLTLFFPEVREVEKESTPPYSSFSITLKNVLNPDKTILTDIIKTALINAGLENIFQANKMAISAPLKHPQLIQSEESKAAIKYKNDQQQPVISLASSLQNLGSPITAAGKARETLISKVSSLVEKNPHFQPFLNLLNGNHFAKALRTACNDSRAFELVEIILEYKDSLNININEAPEPKKQTALHYAALKNRAAYDLLLQYGADSSIKNSENNTAEVLLPKSADLSCK